MPICKNCNKEFPNKIIVKSEIFNLTGRKFCPDCSPIGSRNTRSYIVKLQENEAFCIRCKQIKNKDEFYARKNNGKPFSYCIDCQELVKKLKLEEKLERIIQIRGGACQDCGQVFPSPVYDFYSEDNTFHISKARNMSLERLLIELEKYIMICKNCIAIRKWEKI
jgi:hypothetical protein